MKKFKSIISILMVLCMCIGALTPLGLMINLPVMATASLGINESNFDDIWELRKFNEEADIKQNHSFITDNSERVLKVGQTSSYSKMSLVVNEENWPLKTLTNEQGC